MFSLYRRNSESEVRSINLRERRPAEGLFRRERAELRGYGTRRRPHACYTVWDALRQAADELEAVLDGREIPPAFRDLQRDRSSG